MTLAILLAGILARSGFPLPATGSRIGCVDGLRGFLALGVMVHHAFLWILVTRYGKPWQAPPLALIDSLGSGSVRLFFMITGLVFYPRVLAGFRAIAWPRLYIGRLFRILPLVIASVFSITALIMLRTGARPDADWPVQALSWITAWEEVDLLGYPRSAMLNAWVLWSLWYEWLFYLLLLPACAAAMDLVRALRLPTIMVPAALFATGVAALAVNRLAGAEISVLRYAPVFAVGMLAYELRTHPRLCAVLARPRVGWLALMALGAGMAMPAGGLSSTLPLYAFFFLCVVCGNPLGGLLTSRGALVLGEVSFGIYLLHGTVLAVAFREGAPLFAGLAAPWVPLVLLPLVPIVVLVTAGTFVAIERPGMRLGRRLAERLRDPAPRPAMGQAGV